MFIAVALPPSFAQASYHFVTDELHISNEVQSAGNVGMWAVMLLSTMGYQRFFAGDAAASNKTIFFYGQLGSALCVLPTIALVLRYNVAVGVPDVAFMLGADAVTTVVSRIFMMRFMVMAAKLCPRGAEATLFACFMSLCNFSYQVSAYTGAYFTTFLDIRTGKWFISYIIMGHIILSLYKYGLLTRAHYFTTFLDTRTQDTLKCFGWGCPFPRYSLWCRWDSCRWLIRPLVALYLDKDKLT